MWVNIGKSQFHLPTGDALVFRGHIGIVTPSREQLLDRFAGVQKELADSKFSFKEHNDYVEATCPWGNQFRFYEPDEERFGKINLGIPYVEFTVPERHRQAHRPLLSQGARRAHRRREERRRQGRAYQGRPQPGADLPRDRPATAGI